MINTSSSYERTAVVFKTIFWESKKRKKKEIKHSVFGEPSGVVSHLVDEIRK